MWTGRPNATRRPPGPRVEGSTDQVFLRAAADRDHRRKARQLPGSRHSPAVPADKKQIATPEKAPPSIPALTRTSRTSRRRSRSPRRWSGTPSSGARELRRAAVARRVRLEAVLAVVAATAASVAAGARLAGVAAGARHVAERRAGRDREARGPRSSAASRRALLHCTRPWAPGCALSLGCFNPFADGDRLDYKACQSVNLDAAAVSRVRHREGPPPGSRAASGVGRRWHTRRISLRSPA